MNPGNAELRQQIQDLVQHLEHVLPGQAPIKDFVHHNTLHGYQHLHFREAVDAAYKASGARGYLSDDSYRALYREGRITQEHLLQVLNEDEALDAQSLVVDLGEDLQIRLQDLYLLALTAPIDAITPCQLNWQADEMNILAHVHPDVPEQLKQQWLGRAASKGLADESAAIGDLWQACLESLGLEHFIRHPEDLLDLLLEENELTDEDSTQAMHIQQLVRKDAARQMMHLLESVGTDNSLRGLINDLTGIDLMHEIRLIMIRRMAAFLDQGLAAWATPGREKGFYHAWRNGAARDPAWIIDSVPEWQDHLESLPDDPLDTIIVELMRMDLPKERWVRYLEIKALELPGWSGMFLWRHFHPGYDEQGFPVKMLDYLAVRMVLERLLAQRVCRDIWQIEPGLKTLRGYFRPHADEFFVRYNLFNSRLPEHLATQAQKLVGNQPGAVSSKEWQELAHAIKLWQMNAAADQSTEHSVFNGGWRLFLLAQHLGFCGDDIRRMSTEQLDALLAGLDKLDAAQRGFIWLQAYEHQYRDQLFAAVAANHLRGRWQERENGISAQLVFCMDDREEGMRRHLEEVDASVETLGAAAHFGVPHLWMGLDNEKPVGLTPVVYDPVHLVREKPVDGYEEPTEQHRQRRKLRLKAGDTLNQDIRRNLASSALLIAAAAPGALLDLAGKVLAPLASGRLAARLRDEFEGHIPTRLALTAEHDSGIEPTPDSPRQGFTDGEQLQRVALFLQNLGLTSGFAPLVVFMGHGSDSRNNPHLAAYDCGACSGRHSGPNARIFCAMANRPVIRQRLAEEYDIHIPESTWFIGAEHNTCTEEIQWYDVDLLPGENQDGFNRLLQSLDEAAQRHAHERCRKFVSAPDDPTPAKALEHVIERRYDFSQARPELGHATNAAAFIGRRALSQGAFFDRRVFLISYDYRIDPEGEILERLLLANGPVGAGISLEYYFSTVDNDNYGAGTKIMHNVTGLLGVMEGASSDLRTGLPRQMIEIHEAMRLQVLCEATTGMLTKIYLRQPPLQELVGKGWLLLSAKDPESGEISVFQPEKGWIPWEAPAQDIPEVQHSDQWYTGHIGPLSPALIQEGAADA